MWPQWQEPVYQGLDEGGSGEVMVGVWWLMMVI
jgi:hypothetical protein